MRTYIIAAFIIIAIGLAAGFVTSINMDLPDIAKLTIPNASTQLLDSDGNCFYTLHAVEDRVPIALDKMPSNMPRAVIAIEDARFYQHPGIDAFGVIRALFRDITYMHIAEGASTITQQLARNALLTHNQTVLRKLKEAVLAIKIERRYTKNQILEMYLNQVYFGHGVYGIQAAAREYFDKPATQLNLQECAFLAGLPQRPNYYTDPNNSESARARMQQVLHAMLEQKFIDEDNLTSAINNPPTLVIHHASTTNNYFAQYVTQSLVKRYGYDSIYRDGLSVNTTLNSSFQEYAAKALTQIPAKRQDANGLQQPQYALVCIENSTGAIRAMIGGRGGDEFNRAVLAYRQPGSSIKPFVYYQALARGMTPQSQVTDQPISFAGYAPSNYDNKYHGTLTLTQALTNSYNTIAVQLANTYGIQNIQNTLIACGITSLITTGSVNDNNLALALGGMSKGVTTLEMATAYSTLAKYGNKTNPIAIQRIRNREDNIIFTPGAPASVPSVLDKKACIELVSMMQEVVRSGTGQAANINRPAAGKTGTTSDFRDAWFCGFTPEYTTVIWMGNDDNSTLGKLTGGDYPAAVWHDFMAQVVKDTPVNNFIAPVQQLKKP